jgi:prefoldin subunit 5
MEPVQQQADQIPQPTTREDYEAAIEMAKDRISDEKYALRWLFRAYWAFGGSLVIAPIAFTMGWIFPGVNTILSWVGGTACFVAFCLGIGIAAVFLAEDRTSRRIHEHRKRLRETQRILEKLQRRLASFEEQALRHLTPEQYMHQLPKLISSYRRQADGYRNRFIAMQIVTILLSAAITSLSGGWLDRYIVLPWVIPVMSAIISVLTSFTLFFKFREKGVNLLETANGLDWEHMACTLGIGKYEGLSRADALRLLAKTCEDLRKEQQKRQVQLEQSSHAEQKALQAST